MTKKQLQDLCYEWQKRLRLLDWNIQVGFKRFHEMPEDAGQVLVNEQHKAATIHILNESDTAHLKGTGADYSVEHTLVHELLHLHMIRFEPKESAPENEDFEIAINLIAGALIGN